MELRHFKSPQAALDFALNDYLWFLREDLAAMEGPDGDNHSDQEWSDQLDKVADVEALLKHFASQGADAVPTL